MVNEMIYQKVVKHPNAVIEGGEPFFQRGDIPEFRKLWPQKQKQRKPHTDLVEGWEAVAYNRKVVDTKAMEELADLSTKCLLSDDLVISFVLARQKTKKIAIGNGYFTGNPHPYDYGTGEDALHRGAGAGEGVKASGNSDDYNWEKYQHCLKDICYSGKGPPDCDKALSETDKVKRGGEPKRSSKARKPKRSSKARKPKRSSKARKPKRSSKARKPKRSSKARKPKRSSKARKPKRSSKARKPKRSSKARKPKRSSKARKPKRSSKARKPKRSSKARKPKRSSKARKSKKCSK